MMDSLKHKDNWFSELGEMWPGQAASLEIEKILFEGKSDFQDILVCQTKAYGRMLALDGAIQVTERDEHSYQEMITHLPMFCHPCPKRVLIIGGGDGGVLREVVKHQCVEEAHLVDIDKMVIEVSKKYLQQTAIGFDHPKSHVHVCDGFEFLKDHVGSFDVIISDSSDPVGPAASLFQKQFYVLAEKALRPGGVLCVQCESIWLHMDVIKSTLSHFQSLFPTIGYANTLMPTYPSGIIGFALARKDEGVSPFALTIPVREGFGCASGGGDSEDDSVTTKYYNVAVHQAAFVLPEFARAALAPILHPVPT